MQLGCLLVHFAWNIIFVIVIVCGFFGGVFDKNAVFSLHTQVLVCVEVVVSFFFIFYLIGVCGCSRSSSCFCCRVE